jgi:hypothetical protein
MAQKRRIEMGPGDGRPEAQDADRPELQEKFRGKSWRDWFLSDYLRYWYLLGCGFVDVMATLELLRELPLGLALPALVPFLFLALYLEHWFYKRHFQQEDGENPED